MGAPAAGRRRCTTLTPDRQRDGGDRRLRDGRRVYFAAPGPAPRRAGRRSRENGAYLWQAGQHAGGGHDLVRRRDQLQRHASRTRTRRRGTREPSVSRVTPDGRTLLLGVSDESRHRRRSTTTAACAPSNPNGTVNGSCSQLYVYRADASTPLAPAIACASCPPSGAPPRRERAASTSTSAPAPRRSPRTSAMRCPTTAGASSSAAPRRSCSRTRTARPTRTSTTCRAGRCGCSRAGSDAADSWFLDASANGDDAFFVTRERLVGWDVDAPTTSTTRASAAASPSRRAPVGPCDGDTCRGQAQRGAAGRGLGSATLCRPARATARPAATSEGAADAAS